jgi:hypothetical protein
MIIVLIFGIIFIIQSLFILIQNYRSRYNCIYLTENDSKVLVLQDRMLTSWVEIFTGQLAIAFSALDSSTRPYSCIISVISIMAGLYISLFKYQFKYSREVIEKINDFSKYQKENETFLYRIAGILVISGGLILIGSFLYILFF